MKDQIYDRQSSEQHCHLEAGLYPLSVAVSLSVCRSVSLAVCLSVWLAPVVKEWGVTLVAHVIFRSLG